MSMFYMVYVVFAESTSGTGFVRDQQAYGQSRQTSTSASSKAEQLEPEHGLKGIFIYEFPKKVVQELAADPIALTCSAMLVAYMVGQALFGGKKSMPVTEKKRERKPPKKPSCASAMR